MTNLKTIDIKFVDVLGNIHNKFFVTYDWNTKSLSGRIKINFLSCIVFELVMVE